MKLGCFLLRRSRRTTKLFGSSKEAELTKEAKGRKSRADRKLLLRANKQETRPRLRHPHIHHNTPHHTHSLPPSSLQSCAKDSAFREACRDRERGSSLRKTCFPEKNPLDWQECARSRLLVQRRRRRFNFEMTRNKRVLELNHEEVFYLFLPTLSSSPSSSSASSS